MDLQHGILLFVIGSTVTFIGFFIAFLVINYNKKKEDARIKRAKEPRVYPWGDDTV